MNCFNNVSSPEEMKNFAADLDLVFRDAHDTVFDLYQCCSGPGEDFRRVPAEVSDNTNEGVKFLALHSSGIRLRLKTNSRHLAMKVKMRHGVNHMNHMPLTGSSGFDFFLYDKGVQTFKFHLTPPCDCTEFCGVHDFGNDEVRDILINFPLYNQVTAVEVGLDADAEILAPSKYRPIAPVLYYGSSITQGGCASRPGNAYQSIISRRFDLDFINMGFSGSARGEDIMVDFLTTFEPSVFVCDYDHNAPSHEHLENTHYRLYERYRAVHPKTPIVFVTKPDPDQYPEDAAARRAIIKATFDKAREQGDGNVWFIDGGTFFGSEDRTAFTVDGCHPTDLGFWHMANGIGDVIGRILGII